MVYAILSNELLSQDTLRRPDFVPVGFITPYCAQCTRIKVVLIVFIVIVCLQSRSCSFICLERGKKAVGYLLLSGENANIQ